MKRPTALLAVRFHYRPARYLWTRFASKRNPNLAFSALGCVSLDTVDAARFAHITRGGELDGVLAGIAAARAAGLKVKINMVALRGINEDEIEAMLRWCAAMALSTAPSRAGEGP